MRLVWLRVLVTATAVSSLLQGSAHALSDAPMAHISACVSFGGEASRSSGVGGLLNFSLPDANFVQRHSEGNDMETAGSDTSPALRNGIENFLRERFDARDIDPGLLKIILARIEAEAAGRQESALDRHYPKVNAYPSVAQQISWQYALNDIAKEFRHNFPAGYEPRQPAVQIEGADSASPLPDKVLLWRVPQIVESAQGAFSFLFAKSPIPAEFGAADGTINGRPSWAAPLRIAPTGVNAVDARIAAELKKLWVVDDVRQFDASAFPAKIQDANLFLPRLDVGGSTLDRLWFCANASPCETLSDLAQPPHMTGKDMRQRTSSAFFNNLYLLNPYGGRSSTSAIVRVDTAGQITAGFAGALDMGYVSLRSPSPTIDGRLGRILIQLSRPFDTAANNKMGVAELDNK